MRVVLVLCDGVGDGVAREHMGYLEQLVEQGIAGRFVSRATLPTMSRPNYETIHTGLVPRVHGITGNGVVQRSTSPNLFVLCSQAGLATAAVAYHWISELYHKAPFDRQTDSEYDDPTSSINHGRFYDQDDHPDHEVIRGALALSKRFAPDYLLVHPMGADLAGHLHGGQSAAYRAAVGNQDQLLAVAIPRWREAGCAVLVTADHGHVSEGGHGGPSDEERNVPLYAILPTDRISLETDEIIEHTQLAPTICELLGLEIPGSMQAPPIKLWA
ncbi:MAG: alkaline phosphatase family protein [Acidimicrobiia bacterium]|nr:MAG: alkaline phosphatase family protein [Acidimicrobiia bacterium]